MSTISNHVRLQDALSALPLPANEKWPHGVFDVEVMRNGTMSTVLYAPQIEDFQTSHAQDELYFVASGASEFLRGDERFNVAVGDAFFVAANVPHRFEKFSKDFTVWAVFWGPKGGEK